MIHIYLIAIPLVALAQISDLADSLVDTLLHFPIQIGGEGVYRNRFSLRILEGQDKSVSKQRAL